MQRHLRFVWLTLLPAVAFAAPSWRGDFETGDLSQWSKAQAVSADRLQVVTSPTHQGQYALKVTVKQGDNPIGASGNRNELVREETNPEGAEQFYRWSTMFANDYPSERAWQVFTQFHQSGCCGSPPIEFDIYGEEISLVNSEHTIWSAPLVRGQWHDFIFHVKWSNDPNVGFVELYYDGQLVLPKTYIATGTDTYLKQGLYRNSVISGDGVVYHDGMVLGSSLEDVMPSDPPPPDPAPAPSPSPSPTPTPTPTPTGTGTPPPTGQSNSPAYTSGASAGGQSGGGCSATGGDAMLWLTAPVLLLGLLGSNRRRVPARVRRDQQVGR